MRKLTLAAGVAGMLGSFVLGWTLAGKAARGGGGDKAPAEVKGWTKGKGWGPWGKDDEVGSLNAMTPESIKAALQLVKQGKVYDLGVPYDAESFRWPGHNPADATSSTCSRPPAAEPSPRSCTSRRSWGIPASAARSASSRRLPSRSMTAAGRTTTSTPR